MNALFYITLFPGIFSKKQAIRLTKQAAFSTVKMILFQQSLAAQGLFLHSREVYSTDKITHNQTNVLQSDKTITTVHRFDALVAFFSYSIQGGAYPACSIYATTSMGQSWK